VLRCAATWLEPSGLLVLQTPNAAALFKRLKLLAGRNPYHMIRETRTNPGHFREYTLTELRRAVDASGLELVRCERRNYFDGPSWWHAVYRATRRTMPDSLRQGITMVLRRPLGR
jgi:hypothetical protein